MRINIDDADRALVAGFALRSSLSDDGRRMDAATVAALIDYVQAIMAEQPPQQPSLDLPERPPRAAEGSGGTPAPKARRGRPRRLAGAAGGVPDSNPASATAPTTSQADSSGTEVPASVADVVPVPGAVPAAVQS